MNSRTEPRRDRSPFFVVLLLLLAVPGKAFGYLDPGTGSLLIQVTIGAVAAGLAVCKLYWRKISNVFRKSEQKMD